MPQQDEQIPQAPVGQLKPIAPVGQLRPIQQPQFDPYVHAGELSKQYGLDPNMMNSLIKQESNWNPKATSPKGAQGLMQLMPNTARQMGVQDPYDSRQNEEGGFRYFKQLLDQYGGNYEKAIQAYNAGPTAVNRGVAGQIPETARYTQAVEQGAIPKAPVGQTRPLSPQGQTTQPGQSKWTAPGTVASNIQQRAEGGNAGVYQDPLSFGIEGFPQGEMPSMETVQHFREDVSAAPPVQLGANIDTQKHPYLKGAAEFASGLGSSENLALMFGGGGAIGALPTLARAALTGTFSAQMLNDAYNKYPEYKAMVDRGQMAEAHRLLTHGLLSGGLGLLTLGEGARESYGAGREATAPSVRERALLDLQKATQGAMQAPETPVGQTTPLNAVSGPQLTRERIARRATERASAAPTLEAARSSGINDTASRGAASAAPQPSSAGKGVAGRPANDMAAANRLESPQYNLPGTADAQLQQSAPVQTPGAPGKQAVQPPPPVATSTLTQETASSKPPVLSKATRIEEQQVKSRPEWTAQQKSMDTQRLEAIVKDPKATPEEKSIARKQLRAGYPEEPKVAKQPTSRGEPRNLAERLEQQRREGRISQKEIDRISNRQSTIAPEAKKPVSKGPRQFSPEEIAESNEMARLYPGAFKELKPNEEYRSPEQPVGSKLTPAIREDAISSSFNEAKKYAKAHPEESTATIAKMAADQNQVPEEHQEKYITRLQQVLNEDRLGAPKPKVPATAPSKPSEATKSVAAGDVLGQLENRVKSLPGADAGHVSAIRDAVDALKLKGGEARNRYLDALRHYGTYLRKGDKAEDALSKTMGGITKREGEKGAAIIPQAVGDAIHDEIDRNKISRRIHEGTYDLGSANQADLLRITQAAKVAKGGRRDYEAIYHWMEDPNSTSLTPAQRTMFKDEIRPFLNEARRISQKLSGSGLSIQQYVHRIALNKNSKLERLLLGRDKFSPGSVLSTYAPGAKSRKMWAMTDPRGNRQVVAIKGDKVFGYRPNGRTTQLGSLDYLQRQGWRQSTATTKEIERATPTRYIKNALATTMMNYAQLRRAERAHDFLEHLKTQPDFKDFAYKVGEGTPPAKWETSNVPQLRDYYFEPHVREVLDRYWDSVKKGDTGAMEKLNKFLRTSIFFNPALHMPNILNHWAVEKGVTGWMPQNWGMIVRTSARAYNAIMHQNQDMLDALDVGAPFQSQRATNDEATALIWTKLVKDAVAQPSRLAKTLGYAHPAKLVQALYDFSSKVTWVTNDIATLQASYAHMEKHGGSLRDALKEVGKHIPNYRLPTRILDSPWLGKVMNNPQLSMFSAYHYGALRSYTEMAKELAFNPKAGDRAKAFDRMAMLALVTFAVYPLMDRITRGATGDDSVRWRRAGASTFVDNMVQLSQGKKGIVPVGEAIVTPSPLVKAGLALEEQLRKPLPAAEVARRTANIAAGEIGPVGTAQRTSKKGQPIDWKRFFQGMVGIQHQDQHTSTRLSRVGSIKKPK